jgi:hypothetical protein
MAPLLSTLEANLKAHFDRKINQVLVKLSSPCTEEFRKISSEGEMTAFLDKIKSDSGFKLRMVSFIRFHMSNKFKFFFIF